MHATIFIFREPYKIIKTAKYTLLFVSVYFLSVPHLQYQHILLTRVLRRNFKKWTISGTCTNNGSKIELGTNRGRITFAWIWGLHLHGERALQLPVKYDWEFFFTFARIACYLEYIQFIHNIFCILPHDWRCNLDIHHFRQPLKWKQKI